MAVWETMTTVPHFIIAGALAGGLALSLAHTWPSDMRAREKASYAPVTDQRLRDAEPGNWLMYRRTYNGWGYSPLGQITSSGFPNAILGPLLFRG